DTPARPLRMLIEVGVGDLDRFLNLPGSFGSRRPSERVATWLEPTACTSNLVALLVEEIGFACDVVVLGIVLEPNDSAERFTGRGPIDRVTFDVEVEFGILGEFEVPKRIGYILDRKSTRL